jgi:acylphosphatase
MTVSGRHYHISGRVQGVGFRHFTWLAANRIGLSGWVRNRVDGSVEVKAWGPESRLTQFRAELESGPRYSNVDEVVETPHDEPAPPAPEFRVRPTR